MNICVNCKHCLVPTKGCEYDMSLYQCNLIERVPEDQRTETTCPITGYVTGGRTSVPCFRYNADGDCNKFEAKQ